MKRKIQALLLAVLSICTSSVSTGANQLSLGNESKVPGTIMIPVVGFSNLNGITVEDLYKRRTEAVFKYKQLVSDKDTYQPSDSIFGSCESGKPWWGTWGMYVYREGQKSILGPAKESTYIFNPFRLISAEQGSVGLWNSTALGSNELRNPRFPFLWESGPVLFNPKLRTARVWYNVTKFNSQLAEFQKYMRVHLTNINGFSLIAYNARDFGFNYIYMDPAKSINIQRWRAQAVPITQFLHCGGSCGYPGGCNNMSPFIKELDRNYISKLPARAVFKLWVAEPESVSDAADFTYVMDFQ